VSHVIFDGVRNRPARRGVAAAEGSECRSIAHRRLEPSLAGLAARGM